MSALGQKRTHAVQNIMSALLPKADMRRTVRRQSSPLSLSGFSSKSNSAIFGNAKMPPKMNEGSKKQ